MWLLTIQTCTMAHVPGVYPEIYRLSSRPLVLEASLEASLKLNLLEALLLLRGVSLEAQIQHFREAVAFHSEIPVPISRRMAPLIQLLLQGSLAILHRLRRLLKLRPRYLLHHPLRTILKKFRRLKLYGPPLHSKTLHQTPLHAPHCSVVVLLRQDRTTPSIDQGYSDVLKLPPLHPHPML